jgi:hypothetical protein
MKMKKQLTRLFLAAGLLALFVPVAAAQSWPDYRRDRDYGRNDTRYVRDSIQRLDRLARDFERELDRELDRNRRVDGTRREDRINTEAHDFRNAVGDLKSAFGNGRDLNRSADEAQRVFQQANTTERMARRFFNNSRVSSLWSQIRNELNTIRNFYGHSGSIYGDDDYRRNRRNDNQNVPWWQRIPFPY